MRGIAKACHHVSCDKRIDRATAAYHELSQNVGNDSQEHHRHKDSLRLEVKDFLEDRAEDCQTRAQKEEPEGEWVQGRIVVDVKDLSCEVLGRVHFTSLLRINLLVEIVRRRLISPSFLHTHESAIFGVWVDELCIAVAG